MNGLLLPVKGLTCTSASPQGDPQLHVHIHEPSRGSPDSRAHARAHKEIPSPTCTSASPQGDPQLHVHIREPTRTSASPRAYPRPSAQDCRARSALTHIDNHSPAHRHPGTRPQPRIRGTQPRPRQLERGKREHATEQRQDTARRIQKSRIRRSGLNGGRYWDRTSDLFRVKEARYPCANRPRWVRDSNPCIRLCRPLPRLSAIPPRPMGSCGFPIESG